MSSGKTNSISTSLHKRKKRDNPPINTVNKTLKVEKLKEAEEEERAASNSMEIENEPEKQPMEPNENVEKNLNETSIEFYLDKGYCSRNNNLEQYYAKDVENNEMYWQDSNGNDIYAYKKAKIGDSEYFVEYPAKLKDGSSHYIFENGIPRYPENLTTDAIIFPKNQETNEEMYLRNLNGDVFYPKNKYGHEFYRKDLNGDDVPINAFTYAKDASGSQIYPKRQNGDEYYLKLENNDCEIGAKRLENGEFVSYYARKANGNEFYPRIFLRGKGDTAILSFAHLIPNYEALADSNIKVQ